MAKIIFSKGAEEPHVVDAVVGETLMQAAKAHGVAGIEAECGGSMVCGTCHVYVAEQWFSRLPAPSAMEADMLDCSLHPQPNSRLSCQLVVDASMEGMTLLIPPSQR